MTTSYLLSKKYPRKCTSWSSYQTNDRICPEGFNTYHQGKHGWKVCSLQYEKDGSTWQDGSGNKTECNGPKNGMLPFQATLYNPDDCPQGMYETIPYQLRIRRFNLHEPRSDLDRLDYFQLPMKYSGTGYENLRSRYNVQGKYGKLPQYADDDVTYPPVWNETLPVQNYLVNEMAKQGRDEDWSTLTSRSDYPTLGGFYGEPVLKANRGW